MNFILRLVIQSFAVFIAAYLLRPAIYLRDFWAALAVAVVLGVVNALVKPILFFFTLPLNILTLGLFTFVINGIAIALTAWLVPGFSVRNLLWAIIFSVVLSLVGWLLNTLAK